MIFPVTKKIVTVPSIIICRTCTIERTRRRETDPLPAAQELLPPLPKGPSGPSPGRVPKALFGNQLIARIAFMHYVHGIPLGRICDQMSLDLGSIVQMLHRLAGLFKPVLPRLIELSRMATVRHADETSWRTDGHSGYAWLFCTPDLSLFMFRQTRAASVPREVFGNQPLPGVLVVDRYNGYNRVCGRIKDNCQGISNKIITG